MVIGMARSINGEVARLFAKDLVPDVGVGFLGDKDSCKEDRTLNEGSHGVEDSTIEVNYGKNGSFPVYKKKRKVVSPRSNLLSFLEDDTVQNGLACYRTKLDQGSTRLAEGGAEQIGDNAKASASASEAINKCSSTDAEDKISGENFYVADLDDNLADGNKLHMNVDLPSISHHLSLCADRSDVLASNSGDELLVSGFDMQSCMSSPEELLSFSDFSRNTKTSACQSENEMISGESNMSVETFVSGDPSTCSLGKSLDKIASDNSQTNPEIPPSLPEDISKAVEKLNLVHGKLALSKHPLASAGPKVFSGHHPPNFSNSRKFHPAPVTKSRTWHRTGNNSVSVTEPKLQSSPVSHSHATKTARTAQNSYIRKGNSLVRKPSPAAVSLPGCHGSTSSVYRLNACMDNLKGNQASNSNTHHAGGPTVPRVQWVNTSEMPKAQSPNHCGQSLGCTGCNFGESVPGGNPSRSGSPFKTSGALEESMKSPIVPERRTYPVINSDSQSTLEEGNTKKKIMYVKRRSNQLVAASNSDDTSMSEVDKTQASLSDGYYKSKKNQLLRASPENHVKKEDANVNSGWLVSHTIIPRSSSRRQSFAKTYRHLKFSSVWKLHDTQSSEKPKNLVGPPKVLPHLFPKKATYWRSFIHALSTKPKNSPFSAASRKLLLSRKRGAIYTRSIHGYSLRMSKVLSVGGTSLKWSKSIERNSTKANEEATRAVAAAEKRKKEGKGAVSTALKSRNHVSRKSVLSVKLRPGTPLCNPGVAHLIYACLFYVKRNS
ncbi:hypothetical protein CDL12_10868 [Handroanthus impetiginosus]|uniref:Uncharacterized protein n=1 Tax=Handroanthus impetiginosus TaxID=429701 RepID=A0A2G9HG11_9LAMI|nr:hypothetical protein CDL12_10868 [Handroanthus impetiginosus]